MKWTQKEKSLLKDLKNQEQLCVDKYGEYAARACDPDLRRLFEDIRQTEQQHLRTVCDWLGEQPAQNAPAGDCPCADFADVQQAMAHDKYLCQDALCTEKKVSSTYDVCIFEFCDPQVRQQLHQIQGAEQQHGEMLYQYRAQNGMYQVQCPPAKSRVSR